MKVLQIGIVCVVLVSLASCSVLGADGKRIDYGADASKVPTLEIPPDLTAPGTDETYRMPQGDGGAVATYSDYSKGGAAQGSGASAVLPEIPGVRLERNAAQRWLRISDQPENVWPEVKAFWKESGLSIKSEEQAAGVMETDWVENRAKFPQAGFRNDSDQTLDNGIYSVGERDQYRTRLERGKDGASTEVYITHRGMEEVFSNDKKVSQWQARGNDPEKEAVMLQRLMVRFGSSEARAKDALAATGAGTVVAASAVPAISPAAVSAPELAGTASLREIAGGNTIIVVNDPFDRAWRKAGLAIESAGLAVEDKDREKGIYYLRPIKIETGWMDKMKFWKSNEDTARHYRVNVRDGGASSEVSITDQNGASNKASKQMLEAMFKNINKQ
jgi:outer membrane protein assembly factor BamC